MEGDKWWTDRGRAGERVMRESGRDVLQESGRGRNAGERKSGLWEWEVDYGVERRKQTNWPFSHLPAYATGLLVARRLLKKLGLDSVYEGKVEPDGEYFTVEEADGERRPFQAFLDVGLARTTSGSKVFAAMKGAADGGMLVPHSESRFPGYDPEAKKLDAEVLKKYIYGGHVKEYMEYLEEEDEESYKKQFAKFLEAGVGPDELEDMYKEAHEKIREDPEKEVKERKELSEADKAKLKKFKAQRRNLKQRRDTVKQK